MIDHVVPHIVQAEHPKQKFWASRLAHDALLLKLETQQRAAANHPGDIKKMHGMPAQQSTSDETTWLNGVRSKTFGINENLPFGEHLRRGRA